MHIESLETPCLGNRSYVFVDGRRAVVVDPPRDIDRVEAVLDRYDATPALVVETHRHADYVSGGLELSRRHRAAYVVPPGEPEPRFAFEPAVEGVTYDAGAIGVRALATPGHTPHHVAVVVEDTGQPVAVCTGGALLHGSVGRTDLHGAERTRPLAHAQWRSARRLVEELPPDTRLLPTHGFGSLCSAGPGSDSASATLGEESAVNPALVMAEHAFVSTLVAGFGPVPRHYTRLPLLNAAGPTPVEIARPQLLEPDDLQRHLVDGGWLVDVRDRRAFAAAHLRGSVNVEVTGPLVAYLPWILPAGAGIVLLGGPDEVDSAQRQLTQVGVDRPVGAALGSPRDWAGGDARRVASYACGTFAQLRAAQERGAAVPLDVRTRQEWDAGHVDGAVHLALPDVADRVDPGRPDRSDIDVDGDSWVYCGVGFRAAIAASLLSATGRTVTLVDDPYDAAVSLGMVRREPVRHPA